MIGPPISSIRRPRKAPTSVSSPRSVRGASFYVCLRCRRRRVCTRGTEVAVRDLGHCGCDCGSRALRGAGATVPNPRAVSHSHRALCHDGCNLFIYWQHMAGPARPLHGRRMAMVLAVVMCTLLRRSAAAECEDNDAGLKAQAGWGRFVGNCPVYTCMRNSACVTLHTGRPNDRPPLPPRAATRARPPPSTAQAIEQQCWSTARGVVAGAPATAPPRVPPATYRSITWTSPSPRAPPPNHRPAAPC